MASISITPPVIGQPNSTEDVKTRNALLALQTAINGNLDEVNVPNLAGAFTTYRKLWHATAIVGAGVVAGTYLMAVTPPANNYAAGSTNALVRSHIFYLDPNAYLANARATKLNIRAMAVPNAVAPAITFTVGLYPVATWGGGAGLSPLVQTLGAVIAGSPAAIATPGAASLSTAVSGDFNIPSAGAYVLAVVTSGTTAASAVTEVVAQVEMRQT